MPPAAIVSRRGRARARARPCSPSRTFATSVGSVSAFFVAYRSMYSCPVSSPDLVHQLVGELAVDEMVAVTLAGSALDVDRLPDADARRLEQLRHLRVGRLDVGRADHADGEQRAAGGQREPGGPGVALVQQARHANACPRGRCRTGRRGRARRLPRSAPRSLDRPPERSIGIMPIAGKRYFVFQESMYSALPTKLMRRGTVIMRNAESRNEMWFGQRMAPPVGGNGASPRPGPSRASAGSGRRTARTTSCILPAPASAMRQSLSDQACGSRRVHGLFTGSSSPCDQIHAEQGRSG